MHASPIAGPGFGLGLRTAHYQDFLSTRQRVDWLEIITDNYLVDGGKPLVVLDQLRRDYPIAMHGVAMSIGSAGGLDFDYLARVKALARRIEPMWISDHLCWTGFGIEVLHDLYPMPYTQESASLLIAQIRQAQDFLGRRLVVENVSSYVRFRASSVSEWAFLAHVAEEADCELLLDVNNVFVSSVNHGFSAEAYLQGLPAARVRQIHLAGHSRVDGHIVDTHDHPVAAEVWALYAQACRRFPHVATMIERDDAIPPLAELIDELDHARRIAASIAVETSAQAPAALQMSTPRTAVDASLGATQSQLATYIINPVPGAVPDQVDGSGTFAGDQGMAIYHRAYRERLIEVLADCYAKCALYMGSALFRELAGRFVDGHPPHQRHLGRYGAEFASLLSGCYPHNPELYDLARLEWSLREVFDTADVPAWSMAAIEQEGAEDCLRSWPILHPSTRLHQIRTNAVSIWHAIDVDDEVPEVVRLPRPQALAVWRMGLQPHFKSLDAAEAEFLGELAHEGATIAAVAQRWRESEQMQDPAILGRWLAGWWSDEQLRRDGAIVAMSVDMDWR
jgi:uncharacterized protein (UPF0276 family)